MEDGRRWDVEIYIKKHHSGRLPPTGIRIWLVHASIRHRAGKETAVRQNSLVVSGRGAKCGENMRWA